MVVEWFKGWVKVQIITFTANLVHIMMCHHHSYHHGSWQSHMILIRDWKIFNFPAQPTYFNQKTWYWLLTNWWLFHHYRKKHNCHKCIPTRKEVCIVHGNYIIDGSSEHSALEQTRYSICWRHLATSKETSEKTYFTSYVRNKFLATILYKYHGLIKHCTNVIDLLKVRCGSSREEHHR